MGMMGAGGQIAVREGLRARLIDQMLAQKQQQDMQLQQRRMALDEQDAAQRGQDRTMAMEDRRQAIDDRAFATHDTAAGKAFPLVGMGGAVDAPAFQQTYQGTSSESNFTPERTLPATQMQGGSPLPGAADQTSVQTTTEAPRQITGRMISQGTPAQQQEGQQKVLRGRLMQNPNLTDLQKMAFEAENAGLKVPAGGWEAKTKPGTVHDTKNGLVRIGDDNSITPLGVQGYHPPAAAAGDKLTRVEHKGADGRTVIEYLPQSELRGQTFDKGVGATTETRLASAAAVNQTGDDIIKQLSDPKVAAELGPQMGRYNTLREFIGDPPPQYAELAGKIESYAIANMGVHGMRSSAGAEKIKKLLDGHHTPASMIATIKGLSDFSNHLMQNEGRSTPNGGGTVRMTAPDGRALSVPADKVAELEAHGAKRVP